jgi:two-component sensor histidine kinase
LTIQDDGVGLPTDLAINQLSSLGLKIVYDLVLQLQGELILTRSQGTTFQLIFSELQYRRRL